MEQTTLPAKIDYLDTLFGFIGANMRKAGIDELSCHEIVVAAEEIFVNIASYAFPKGDGNVTISMEIKCEQIVLEFRDRGKAYNPTLKKEPDFSLPAKDREVGGLGIYLTKKLMDEIRYEYCDGQNILTILKNK